VSGDITADMLRKADAFASAAEAHGQPLDYSLESLVALDALLDSLFARRWALRTGGRLDVKQFGQMIEPVGAYLGETLRRTLRGEWVDDGTLRLPSGALADPIEQARRRFEDGHAAGLAAYGVTTASDEGDEAAAR